MDDMSYAPNSNKYKKEQREQLASKTEQPRVKQVVSGTAKTKKKSELASLASAFISDDVHNVKEYLLKDMLVPTVKKAILGVIDMVFNGDGGNYAKRSNEPKVSYRSFFDDPRTNNTTSTPKVSKRFDYDDILFETRGDAEMALSHLRDIISTYRLATVQDLYEIAKLDAPYTSNRYGWTSMGNARVERYKDSYVIVMPKAMPID